MAKSEVEDACPVTGCKNILVPYTGSAPHKVGTGFCQDHGRQPLASAAKATTGETPVEESSAPVSPPESQQHASATSIVSGKTATN